MAKPAPKLKRAESGWMRPFLYAACVFLVLAVVKLLPFWQGISGKAVDGLSTFHPPRPDAPGVIIVAIDEPSFTEINQQWPWPRFYHADLLKALYGAGAKSVAFDIVFADQSHPQDDRDLGEAAMPGTVFAADLTLMETDHASTLVRTDPLPILLSSGAASGIAGVETDRDGAVRKMPSFDDGFMRVLAQTAGNAPASIDGKSRLIQYLGPSGSYPRASYYQALKPDEFLPPDFFKDAVVLVGYSLQTTPDPEANVADTFETPYTLSTGKFMAGVEVQANIYDNFKHGLFIKNPPFWIGFVLLALGAMLGLLVSRFQKISAKWLAGAGVLIGLILTAWLAVRFGRVWLSPWDSGAGLLAVMGTLAARDFAIERRLRGEIQGAFSQYLAPAMVEKIIADPSQLNLGGESKTLTILFADIRGFTGLSETFKTDPQGLTQLINDILTPLADIVMKHGGTIDKFIGDCIMAFWNAPLDDENHAQNGVNAAHEMVDALDSINAQIAEKIGRDDLAVRIGIGLNSGDCVVGNMGSSSRFDYSVLGDPVNVAARLEGLSKTYKRNIVFGENTYNLLSDTAGCEEIDEVQVRGREGKLKIYAAD